MAHKGWNHQDLDDELIEMQATINPSTGLGFEVESKLQTLAGFWDEQKLLIGDFNGDGKEDLVKLYGKKDKDGKVKTQTLLHFSIDSSFEYQSKL